MVSGVGFKNTADEERGGRPRKKAIIFTGAIGRIINNFLNYRKTEERLSRCRIRVYERNLNLFMNFCNKKNINSIQNINLTFLLQFIDDLDGRKKNNIFSAISNLRV